MNMKEMEASALLYAYIDRFRENSDYVMTEAEEKRWQKACDKAQARLYKIAMRHYNEEVNEKIYGG